MASRSIRDEWLLVTLEGLLRPEVMQQLKNSATESYWETAVRNSMITDEALLAALSARFHMKIADLSSVSQQARELVPEQLARKYRVLPLAISDSILDIGTSDPHDLDCERTLAFATGRTVRMTLASPMKLSERIEELYRPENAVEKILEGVSGSYDIQSVSDSVDDMEMELTGAGKASERPVIRLVDHILAEGITSRASDIHLEPEEAGVAVRYRIDGVLRQVMTLPRPAGLPLVSRIKIMASMDIADRLRPQDGRARVMINGVRIDLRISTLPAANGEKVVIRILDSRATVMSVDSLGLNSDEVERIQTLLGVREGIILVTGPTGSGKTTTLYSAIRQIQTRGVNIVTVEDPVEYRLQGIVQVQVNEKAGLTFASALRSILRQDPDVVLVGEIRDRETASIATQASLTGHLVLSTLHTNDAASSVTRLLDIGIESYKIAAALKGIVAQRLIRRLCPKCKEIASEPVPEKYRRYVPEGSTVYKPIGCADCAHTGYRGRMAIVEVLITTPDIERLISSNESIDEIAIAAREGGMMSLFESGIQHVRSGLTSFDEVLRVVEPPPDSPRPSRPSQQRPSDSPDSEGKRRATAPVRPPHRSTPDQTSVATAASSEATPVQPVPRYVPQLGSGPYPAQPNYPVPPGYGPYPYPMPGYQNPTGPLPSLGDERAYQLVGDGTEPKNGKPTVLLVEDEEPLRRVLRDLLERDGYIVAEAQDGVEALDQIDRAGPDVVVLDLNLPRLDGYGVLTHLRSRAKTKTLPVIVLTAKGDEDSEVRVFEYGADDFLTKPFRPRALAARLRALVKRT